MERTEDIAKRLGESLLSANGSLTLKSVRQAVVQARGEIDDDKRDRDVQQQITKLALATRGLSGGPLLRSVRRVVWWNDFQDGAGI